MAPAKLKRRLATSALVACGGLLLLPAAAPAAQLFGINLALEDAQPNQPTCQMLGPCTLVGFSERPAEGQNTNLGAPIDGVITRFRIKALVEQPNTQVTFRVANVTQANDNEGGKSATATAAGAGPTVTLRATGPGEEPIQEFLGRLPVKKGQHLALDHPGNVVVTSDSNGGKNSYEFAPPLVEGAAARTSNNFVGFLLVQAAVEPDADGDGFGDETQDGCPSQKTTQGACDLTKPAITKLRVAKGKIFYTLSENATVAFRLAKKNRRGKFKPVGRSFAGSGAAGPNRRGLPNSAKLGQGVFRLSITATDAVGNSGVKKKAFRIKLKSVLFDG